MKKLLCIAYSFVAVTNCLYAASNLAGRKLLWQKTFTSEINSAAENSDSSRIALTMDPESRTIKDNSYFKGIKTIWHGSKFYYLDNKGSILWEYTPPASTEMYMLKNASISGNGEYTSCSLIKLKTTDKTIIDRDGNQIRTKTQESYYDSILFFDSKGQLKWSQNIKGETNLSANGNYLFITPATDEDNRPLDDFYFLNNKGTVLWKVKAGDQLMTYGMTQDGSRIFIGDTLYDNTGKVQWKLKDGLFTYISGNGLFGIVQYFERPKDPTSQITKTICFDLNTKKELLVFPSIKIQSNIKYSAIYIRPFSEFFIDDTKNNLVTRMNENISTELAQQYKLHKGEVKIYDLKNGKLITDSMNPITYDSYLKTYLHKNGFVKFANNVLYFHEY